MILRVLASRILQSCRHQAPTGELRAIVPTKYTRTAIVQCTVLRVLHYCTIPRDRNQFRQFSSVCYTHHKRVIPLKISRIAFLNHALTPVAVALSLFFYLLDIHTRKHKRVMRDTTFSHYFNLSVIIVRIDNSLGVERFGSVFCTIKPVVDTLKSLPLRTHV